MPESKKNSFQDLIGRVRAGDQEAAAELVRRYEPAIRRAARLRLVDTRLRRILDSTDICQSVLGSFFVRAALGQYELDKPEQLLKLLVSMTRHKVAEQARKQQAERRDIRRVEALGIDERALVARGSSPGQGLVWRELLDEFRARLSAEERQLADQRALGREWAEIAAQLGGSPEARRKQLARAINRVTDELGLTELIHD